MRSKGSLVGLALIAVAATSPASASALVVIGQAPPIGGSISGCFANSESYQAGVSFGADYAVPSTGVIVEWRTQGDPTDAADINALRVYSGSTALAQSRAETLTAAC